VAVELHHIRYMLQTEIHQANLTFKKLCSCPDLSARPRTQHNYLHNTKVKPEAATAVIELLMMEGKTPETC